MGRIRDLALDFTPLKQSRQFRLLYVASSVSAIGSRITEVAIPVQVWRLTHSTLAVGAVSACTMVPAFTFSILGGALADARDRRRLMLGAEAGGLIASALLALNASFDHPQLWLVYVLATISASGYSIGVAPHSSTIPLVIDKEMLTSAMALKSVTYSGAWLLGPAVGGLLIGGFGLTAPYIADVFTFGLALLCLAAMKPVPPLAGAHPPSFASVKEGVRALWRRPAIAGCFLIDLDAMIFGFPSALFPAIAASRFPNHEGLVGLLYSAPFAGSLLASATSGWTKRVHRHGRAVILSAIGWGGGIIAFGLVHSLWASLTLLAVAGAFDMVSGVFRQTILVTATPPEMLGRMEGVGMAVWTTGPALGDLEAGGVAALSSVTASVVSGGVLCVLGAVVLGLYLPGFARYDSRVPEAQPG